MTLILQVWWQILEAAENLLKKQNPFLSLSSTSSQSRLARLFPWPRTDQRAALGGELLSAARAFFAARQLDSVAKQQPEPHHVGIGRGGFITLPKLNLFTHRSHSMCDTGGSPRTLSGARPRTDVLKRRHRTRHVGAYRRGLGTVMRAGAGCTSRKRRATSCRGVSRPPLRVYLVTADS